MAVTTRLRLRLSGLGDSGLFPLLGRQVRTASVVSWGSCAPRSLSDSRFATNIDSRTLAARLKFLEGSLSQLFVRTCVLVPTPDLDDNHQASPASVHLGTSTLVSESRYPLAVLATSISAFAASSSPTTLSFVLCLRSHLRDLIFRCLVLLVPGPPIPLKRLLPDLPATTSSAYSATGCLDLYSRTRQCRCGLSGAVLDRILPVTAPVLRICPGAVSTLSA